MSRKDAWNSSEKSSLLNLLNRLVVQILVVLAGMPANGIGEQCEHPVNASG